MLFSDERIALLEYLSGEKRARGFEKRRAPQVQRRIGTAKKSRAVRILAKKPESYLSSTMICPAMRQVNSKLGDVAGCMCMISAYSETARRSQ
jgi:hypothetical protein